jgi:hypothetical protein
MQKNKGLNQKTKGTDMVNTGYDGTKLAYKLLPAYILPNRLHVKLKTL